MGKVTAEVSFKNVGGAKFTCFGDVAASPLSGLSKPFNTIKKFVR